MKYPKKKELPVGQWEVSAPISTIGEFSVSSREVDSGDKTTLHVKRGFQQYTRAEWGLPDTVQAERVIYLCRIEPRVARKLGGGRSLLTWLTEFVDTNGLWLTAEVQVDGHFDISDEYVIKYLTSKYSFEMRIPDIPHVLVRPPQS